MIFEHITPLVLAQLENTALFYIVLGICGLVLIVHAALCVSIAILRRRARELGYDPYFLEIHGNKTDALMIALGLLCALPLLFGNLPTNLNWDLSSVTKDQLVFLQIIAGGIATTIASLVFLLIWYRAIKFQFETADDIHRIEAGDRPKHLRTNEEVSDFLRHWHSW